MPDMNENGETQQEYFGKTNRTCLHWTEWGKKAKELENKVNVLTNENKILKQGKTNVFAELNEETAESNAMFMDKVADLEQENTELKDKLNNLANVAEVRLANWQKYEKENAELKKESNQLFLEGAKRVEELEAQIEKMKCCTNCKHSRTEYEHCRTDKHEKWEIKEK